MTKAGIIGLGLIGGSLAKALRKYGGIKDIVAFGRHTAPLSQALRDGTITGYTTAIDDTWADCDIIFICTPVHTVTAFVHALRPIVKPGCILTDAGSTKNAIYHALYTVQDICFIGGHPMAGSEKTGYAASVDYLFENAYYLLTPYPHTPADKLADLTELIKKIGALPVVLPSEAHDQAVAAVSHAPHVIAAALVNAVHALDDRCPGYSLRALAAGGFRDITRIASADPTIWQSISLENRSEILQVLQIFEAQLANFKNHLAQQDTEAIRTFFAAAKTYRDSFQNKTGYMKTYELFVDILDKPGAIATVTTHLSINGINIKNIGVVNNREFENGVLQIIVDSEAAREACMDLLKRLNFIVYVN